MRLEHGILVLSVIYITTCTNWYISPLGNNNNSGTSASNPLLYLTNALNKANQGDTINVAAGVYSGANNVGLQISGVTIVGTSGSAATIFQGTSTTPFIFQLINNSNLQGLTLKTAVLATEINGNFSTLYDIHGANVKTGVYLNETQSVHLEYYHVSKSVYYGINAAPYTPLESISVINSYFYSMNGFYFQSNAPVTAVSISNTGFQNNGRAGSSGISFTASPYASYNFSIVNCRFANYNNVAVDIYNTGSTKCNVSVVSTAFVNNNGSCLRLSGLDQIFLSKSEFENCTFYGACYLNFTRVAFINDCSFTNCSNSLPNYGGGAIASVNNDDIYITNCTFSNNAAENYGGSVYLQTTDTLTIDYSTFNASSAYCGAAIFIDYGWSNTLVVSNSMFANNQADLYGAIYTMANGPIKIDNTSFYNNTAQSGSALYVIGQVTVTRATFENNNAAQQGGAICANQAQITISDTVFQNNFATQGGGIYLILAVDANITNTQFEENTATSGGGLYCGTQSMVTLNTVSFVENYAGTGSAYNCGTCEISGENVTISPPNDVSCPS